MGAAGRREEEAEAATANKNDAGRNGIFGRGSIAVCSRPSCRRVAVDRNSILPLHAPYLSFPVIAFAPSQTLPPVPDLAFPFPPPSSPITSLPLPRLSGRYTVPERDGCACPLLH